MPTQLPESAIHTKICAQHCPAKQQESNSSPDLEKDRFKRLLSTWSSRHSASEMFCVCWPILETCRKQLLELSVVATAVVIPAYARIQGKTGCPP